MPDSETTPPYDRSRKRDSLLARMDQQDRLLIDIKTALVGNAEMGTKGLASRVEAVEGKVDSHDRKLWFAGAVLSGVWAAIVAFKDTFFHGK